MTRTATDPSPTPLMEAVEKNLVEHVAYVPRHAETMLVDTRDDLVIVDSGLPSDTFNKVLHARLSPDTADGRIDDALSHFGRVGRPFAWWVGPCSRPLNLEARLRARGLQPSETELGMTLALSQLPARIETPSGAQIERVRTPVAMSDFALVLANLAEPPDASVIEFFERASAVALHEDCPMKLYVAYVDDQPAAVSELFLSGELAGVYMVATSPSFRGRGLGTALTWTALAEGRRLGAATGALQASEAGRRVYERLGFRPCGRFTELSF